MLKDKDFYHSQNIKKKNNFWYRTRYSKLLYDSSVSIFVTKKWIEVNYLSSSLYSVNKNTTFKTSMLISYLYDYSNA